MADLKSKRQHLLELAKEAQADADYMLWNDGWDEVPADLTPRERAFAADRYAKARLLYELACELESGYE